MSTFELVCAGLAVVVAAHVIFAICALRRHPPIGNFIDQDGVRLHYVERGPRDGPVLVLLHGNGAMIQDLAISGLLDLAARKYRVLCFDRPGFGHSARPRWKLWTARAQAKLLTAALRSLAVERPIVLGHSWGASVAIAMGLESDLDPKALVLVSGYYFPTRRFDVWMLAGPAFPILGDVARYTVAPLLSWAIFPVLQRRIFAPVSVPDIFREQFPKSLALRPVALRAAAEESALMVPAAARAAKHYGALRCPVAVIAGSDDKIVERMQAQQLHAILPRSVLKTIPGAGHMVHHVAPAGILDAIDLMKAWPA
jgi:pimeloyl-ACP methyl ester carboxylesterase